jgi:uncharacterized DUF497 family protein
VAKLYDFDWDAGNLVKCQKHGVSAAEIEALFAADPHVGRDEKRSEAEDRYVAVGRNGAGRPIFVVFALRSLDSREFIRPVSARYMHRKEIERYEQKAAPDKI